jgi:CHAT domain-containing protein
LLSFQEDYAGARPYYEQAMAISRRSLDLASVAQSERQQLLMGTSLRYHFHALLSLPDETEATTVATYAQVLSWKGSVLARQQRLRLERQNPKLAALVAELRSTSSQLATLAFATPDPKTRDNWNRQLEKLTTDKEALERELAQKSQSFRQDQELKNLTPDKLLELFPADTALVDFLVYRQSQLDPDKKGKWISQDRLTAFILKPGAAIARLDLGPMAPIDKAITQWRESYKKQPGKDHPGIELRRLLWLPLEKHLAGAKSVIISPDGALGRLPFAALPGSKEGSYLLEEVALTVVPVPRLLPVLLAKKDELEKMPSLLLVGDIDFDADGSGKADAGTRVAATGTRSGERLKWASLPGTRGEIVAIGGSFEKRFGDSKLKILRGEQATQGSLREWASKYSHLHLATHGFFAPPEVRSALAANDQDRLAGDLFDKQGVTGFHPGLLTGLVFAGANKPPAPGQSDGILTALEVAELDLTKVELAVLSACETGLGKVAAGEGILGLQRAFQVAGARTVVASMWSVPDEPTRVLMERFYENQWTRKMGKFAALREAQLWMLREGRAHAGVQRGIQRLDLRDRPDPNAPLPPYYWAAFVLSGDWR